MSKSTRFFEIIQMLRAAKAPLLARDMAETLEVSPRTIYCDIATLQSMQTPILVDVAVQKTHRLPMRSGRCGSILELKRGMMPSFRQWAIPLRPIRLAIFSHFFLIILNTHQGLRSSLCRIKSHSTRSSQVGHLPYADMRRFSTV